MVWAGPGFYFVSGAGRNGKNRLFSRKSVRKEQVFTSNKTCSYWWKKALHQPITKWWQTMLFGCWGTGEVVGVMGQKSDSSSDSKRDSEFWELRDLWHTACLECIVSVLCSVGCRVFSVWWGRFFVLWVKTMRRLLTVEQAVQLEGAEAALSLRHCLHLNENS